MPAIEEDKASQGAKTKDIDQKDDGNEYNTRYKFAIRIRRYC
jgi:hypothetical protein